MAEHRSGRPGRRRGETDEIRLARENSRLRAELERLRDERAEIGALAAFAAHELIGPLLHADAIAAALAREAGGATAGVAAHLDEFRAGTARARRLADALLRDAQSSGRRLDRRAV